MLRPSRFAGFCLLTCSFCLLAACFHSKHAAKKPRPAPPGSRPTTDLPYGKMDTIQFRPDNSGKPIPSPGAGQPGSSTGAAEPGKTYRIALLLPFQTDKFEASADGALPKSSPIALQFYAGAKAALTKMSTDPTAPKLVIDVIDSKVSDIDFQSVVKNPTLAKADVVVGGFRSAQVTALSDWGKMNGKIVVSPDLATPGLGGKNPNFIQLNPSLRAHCTAMLKKALLTHKPGEIVLVCKEKERERLAFFQENSPSPLAEIVVPDAAEGFPTDLKPYFKLGRATIFLVPSWASQDFVNGLFQKVKAQRGKSPVEIFGMPQWKNFENIEADDFESLKVSLAMPRLRKQDDPETGEFFQKFYAETGTAPNDDALNGYDTMILLGKELRRHGLGFPKMLGSERLRGISSQFSFSKNSPDGDSGGWENTGVFVARFVNGRFEE